MSVYNVISYGAAGDGSTDDTTAVQNAMNAVPAAGGEVFFPAGTYRITAALVLPAAPVTVRGEGMDVSVLKATADVDGLTGSFSAFYAMPPTIRDLTIGTTVTNGTKKAIKLSYPSASSVNECTAIIERVSIRPFDHTVNDQRWDYGIELEHCWNARILNVHIHGANNQLTGMARGVHLLGSSNDVVIRDCSIFGTAYAVLSDGACEGTHVVNNTILGCNYGVYCNDSAQHPWAVITGNHIAAQIEAVYLANRAQSIVANNLIYKGGTATADFNGVHISTGAGGCIVTGNIVIEQSGASGEVRGVLVDGSASYGAIIGNFLLSQSSGHGYAVVIASGSQHWTVLGNTRQSGVATVSDGGSNNTVANNNG